jgi:hypothetical protein
MGAEDDLDMLLSVLPPEDAMLGLVKHMFKELAGVAATLDAMAPVIGAIAGKVGLSADEVRRLVMRGTSHGVG